MTIKKLKDLPIVPLTTEQIATIKSINSSHQVLTQEFNESNSIELGFIGQIFYKRLQHHGVSVELRLAIFLLTLMSKPGHAVIWTWTLFDFPQREHKNNITLEIWLENFPNGVPSEESYKILWESQKGINGENTLDNPETWNTLVY